MKVFQMSPVLTLVFTLVLVSVACSQEELTAEQYFKQAESQFAGNNINAAIIQLKNALQKRPDYVEARFLLGKLYLEANDGVSAEKEFNRAKSLGLNDMQLDLLLAKSLKLQSKNNAIVDRYLSVVDKVDGGNTLLATIVSDALLGLGRVDQAEMLVGKLEAVGKNISEVELTTAKLFLLKGDKLKAEKLLKG
ncbi:MAG: tetratricopeptide repeat protein, partial [Gammaproteobacteria bacterium]|nr:tetratricopeptide repeat protein [Gammaproteobacteria bacterium]